MKNYTISKGYIILDENSEVVDWADKLEDAEKIVEEFESSDGN